MADKEEAGEGMQCSDHPYGKNPGGICAFCLQEKLGKLVSSSNGSAPFLSLPASSSSSSPSFRSDYGAAAPTSSSSSRLPFSAPKKKSTTVPTATAPANNVVVFKRSKSVAPRPMGSAISDTAIAASTDSPRKKSFWSFLYLSSADSAAATSGGNKRRSTSFAGNDNKDLNQATTNGGIRGREDQEAVGESPGGSQTSSSSFGRKVARSRSVGCGSRSFSGDFLERISTGFGDCTLRRVESHRESHHHTTTTKHNSCGNKMMLEEQRIKERMKCGGIFGGFGMISASSTYSLSAAATAAGDDDFDADNSRSGSNTARASTSAIRGRTGRSKSWGWAFASPMRAFRPAAATNSPSSAAPIKNSSSSSNGKVGANPSLLAVGG